MLLQLTAFNHLYCLYWYFPDRGQHRILTGPRHFSMVYLELTLFVLVITENKLLLFFIISNFSRYLLIKSLHNKDRPANFFSRDNQKKTFEKYTSEKKEMTVFSTNTDLSRRRYTCIYISERVSRFYFTALAKTLNIEFGFCFIIFICNFVHVQSNYVQLSKAFFSKKNGIIWWKIIVFGSIRVSL